MTAAPTRPRLLLLLPAREAIHAALGARLGDEIDLEAADLGRMDGRSAAARVAATMLAAEALGREVNPAAAVLCGSGEEDLAAALALAKLEVPLVRLGAGAERDRGTASDASIADRVCDLLLCADPAAAELLEREGLASRVVGRVEDDAGPAAEAIEGWLRNLVTAG